MERRHNPQDPHIYSPFIQPTNTSARKLPDPASPTSSTGPAPQSPNTQLTMSLLNNLLQMQGLENNIVQQQIAASGTSSQSTSTNPTNPTSSPNPFPSHLMLEQQIKLSQLQQLQQLQNQIFQQQIALISGQSPSILPTPPLFDATHQPGGSSGSAVDQQGYTGLPTPGPSGEIRPQQDFVSPSGLVNYLEPLPHALVPPPSNREGHSQNSMPNHHRHGSASATRSLDLQRQLMALSQPAQRPQHSPYSGSPNTFHQQQQHPTSPMHTSPMEHMMSPNPFESDMRHSQRPHQHHFGTPNQHSLHVPSIMHPGMPHSAPAHVAFNIYSGPVSTGDGGATIPGLTLGPADTPVTSAGQHRQRLSLSESPRYTVYNQHSMTILDQDISPLTSPWLGAHSTSSTATASSPTRHRTSVSTSSAAGSKRVASSSGDEGGSARKRQSPAIRPTIGMSIARLVSGHSRESGSTSPLGPSRKGSTPPLPSTTSASHLGDRSEPASSGSRSASGSVSPVPNGSQAASGAGPSGGRPATAGGEDFDNGRSSATNDGTRKPFRGSKSTSSTPLLRSTVGGGGSSLRRRSRSRSNAQPMAGSGAPELVDGVQDSPSPVDLNKDSDGGVDRSMPPPPLPAGPRTNPANQNASGSNTTANLGGRGQGNADGSNRDGNMGDGDVGLSMEVDMLENMMGMDGMGTMGGMELGNMNFGGMGMAEMDSIMGMDGMNGMGGVNSAGMNNMNVEMQMGMGMDGMGMGGYNHGMSSMGMMDMSGMDFGQNRQGHQAGEHRGDIPPPSSSIAGSQQQQQQRHAQQPLVPVTPASIMNLGRLGIASVSGANGRLGGSTVASSSSAPMAPSKASTSGPAASSTTGPTTNKKAPRKEGSSARGATPGSNAITTRSGRGSGRKALPAASPGLKPLLPAGGMPSAGASTLPSPRMVPSAPNTPHMAATMAGGAPGVRKTSHKAAEQKRRDSLKTTFDHLRKLLPPIALPNDADADPNMITSPLFHPTAPLLPGALPPRGPPKAGGEGPNKGVSKLQLLICGNEYIRLLKGRVERRDEEIAKLRDELGRLRVVVEGNGGQGNGTEEDEVDVLDLGKDLDAVERSEMAAAIVGMTAGQETDRDGGGDDGMDEGDDEDE